MIVALLAVAASAAAQSMYALITRVVVAVARTWPTRCCVCAAWGCGRDSIVGETDVFLPFPLLARAILPAFHCHSAVNQGSEVFLKGKYVELGVNSVGSFGTR